MAINLSQAFHRTSANPIDETLALTKAEMLTINDNLMPSKYLSVCQDDGFIYLYDKTNSADVQTGKFRKFEGGQQIQVSAMPTAVAALVDKIVQFVGATDSTYTNGYFYKCVNNSGTYSWVATPVQSDGGTSDYSDLTNKPQIGGVTLSGNKSASDLGLAESSKAYQTTDYVDGTIDFTAVIPFLDVAEPKTKKQTTLDTIKNKLKTYFDTVYGAFTAGTGINITNNVISTKQSQQGDIDEIVDVYPTAGELVSIVNAFNKGDIYSTDEKMIGQWVDGKPLYQKAVIITDNFDSPITIANDIVDTLFSVEAVFIGDSSTVHLRYSSNTVANYEKHFAQGYYDSATNKWIPQLGASRLSASQKIIYIFKYTKTTDTAISIGETNEYSTTEKIVGTWINGKPVYQKTFTGELTTDEAWNDFAHNISNLDEIIDFRYAGKRTSDGIYWSFGAKGGQSIDTYTALQFVVTSTMLRVWKPSSDINSFTATIQYTKSTT